MSFTFREDERKKAIMFGCSPVLRDKLNGKRKAKNR